MLLKLTLAYAPASPSTPQGVGMGVVYEMLETYTKEIHTLLQPPSTPTSYPNPKTLSMDSVCLSISEAPALSINILYALCVPSDVLIEALAYVHKHFFSTQNNKRSSIDMGMGMGMPYVLAGYGTACVRLYTADSASERKRLGHNQGLQVLGRLWYGYMIWVWIWYRYVV
ncbi:hypothetical protein EON65_02380 [archaeon]|nr:MAG: hypothetical protein EON65_02380 [archaeon]